MAKSDSIGAAASNLATRYALVVVVILAIVYGSLYPFSFHNSGTIGAGLRHLLSTWKQLPQSRGDFLVNLLLYAPLGLTMTAALSQSRSQWWWPMVVAVSSGTVLSFSIEWTQFYDAGRVSALSDFYLNVAGTLAGSVFARASRVSSVRVSPPSGSTAAFARLLLLAWLGWRLYPYAPTIDLHKYWRSLKPIFLNPALPPDSIFRYAILWFSVAFLLQVALRPRNLMRSLLTAMLVFFLAKIVIVGQSITFPELIGATSALLLFPLFLQRHRSVAIRSLAALLMITVVLSRVLPWHLGTTHKTFQWIPFFGFLHGSLQVNTIAFGEKFYLYGALLTLLVEAGMSLRKAVVLECAFLATTSALQTLLMSRSGEITDAAMAFILGLIYALLKRQYPQTEDSPLRVFPRCADLQRP